MERIAWIVNETQIYWSAVVLTLACAGAICTFLSLYLGKPGRAAAAAVYVPLAMGLSLLLARMAHWYCRPDGYDSLASALDLRTPGGFALMGVFAGCLLAALILRLVCLADRLPELLDCVSLAGGVGIAAGRLAAFFNASDRGMTVAGPELLPWICAMTNGVTGTAEYRIATFLLQSIAVGTVTAALLVFYLAGQRRHLRPGDTCLLFVMCYAASQVVLDSTRYDSLYFRSNGFVSVVQVLSAVALAVGVIVFSVRMVRCCGWKRWYAALWLAIAGCFALAGYMEYHVQRHGDQAGFAYTLMSAALADILLLTFLIRYLARTGEKNLENRVFAPVEATREAI